MKTELQQLEENTKIQKAREQAESITSKLMQLLEEELEMVRWYSRSNFLLLITLIVYTLSLGILLWQGVEGDVAKNILDFAFLLYFVVYARSMYHTVRFREAKGKREGFEEALKAIGILEVEECDCDNCRGRRNKKAKVATSPFKRFKELWERLGSKNKTEAYA